MKSETIDRKKRRHVNIERESSSLQLQKRIISQIESGELLPGEKLFSERAIASMYNVSRMTVQYALNALADKGYVDRVRGSGTFVRKLDVDKMDFGYFTSEMSNSGITAMVKTYGATLSNKVLTKGFIKGNYFANKLKLDPDDEVFALHRIRYSNGEPLAVEYAYLPAHMFDGINEVDFVQVSLYDFMDSKGKLPQFFNEKMQIIQASERERSYLELGEKEPVYYMEYVSYDKDGDVVEFTESYARCDKANVRFRTRV